MKRLLIVIGSMFVGSVALAESLTKADQTVVELRILVNQLQNEVDELKAQNNENWLTKQRAIEIQGLVQDVLADADSRASMLQSGATAGHDGHFFLASADGNYRLELAGHLQVRYVFNSRDEAPAGSIDEDEFGFQLRRMKLQGSGHIINPSLTYAFGLTGVRDDTTAYFEDYYLEYKFDNGMKLRAGRWKQPFARENLTSSSRQMAVERSLILETFNVDRSEGIMLSHKGDNIQVAGAFNDGIDGEAVDFDDDAVNYGLTGRIDVLVAGDWKQMKDFTAWNGEEDAAFVGAAVHYQEGEGDSAFDGDSTLLITADGSIETNGLGLFGAFYYSDIDVGGSTAENYGIEGQLSYNFNDSFEPFIRYEWIMLDDTIAGLVDDDINIITLGFNWYHDKHNAKFTFDVVFVLDHIDDDEAPMTMLDPSSGLGLLDDDGSEDGQVAVRAQYQLKF